MCCLFRTNIIPRFSSITILFQVGLLALKAFLCDLLYTISTRNAFFELESKRIYRRLIHSLLELIVTFDQECCEESSITFALLVTELTSSQLDYYYYYYYNYYYYYTELI